MDMDIAKFFDHVHWDILMGKIAAVIRDKRVLRRIGRYLRAGAMGEGVVVKSVEGTPQGGPLSPLVGVLPTGREPPTDYRLEGWIRRHIRACFWLRWHHPAGRERRLRSLGLRGRMPKVAQSSRGAWHLAGTGSLQSALSNATLRRYGFLMPSDLADS